MTRFWRDGHWRSGRYGAHWVEGHWVDRDDWGGRYHSPPVRPFARPSSPSPSSSPIAIRIADGRRASITVPNANCPVCGARVFFYQNDFGSRVFFDDLGPPWPKHPCTDNAYPSVVEPGASAPVANGIVSHDRTTPLLESVARLLRAREEARRLLIDGVNRRKQLSATDHILVPSDSTDTVLVQTPLTGDGWDRCIVKKCTNHNQTVYFVVQSTSDPVKKTIRFSTVARSDLPNVEETLYLLNDRMSFFSFEDFSPQEVEIERKRSKAVSSARRRKTRRKKRRK
ncbi:YXWGXW repeat-containing protein [Novosphingobium sp.]|uniref:YXWGXW repeat-containing protein n=1 Tax=Novosphingobium sp. TaxID=1874826 RepID=UPI0025D930A9|nr:YXWGXW repeat-containing protein [Novosphingobium sp.]MCC6925118.1 YXWGXW repeat-containing protein [Novosphingobium sp.]